MRVHDVRKNKRAIRLAEALMHAGKQQWRKKTWTESRIEDLEIFAYHGVFRRRIHWRQKFVVSADRFIRIRKAGLKGDLAESIITGKCARLWNCI